MGLGLRIFGPYVLAYNGFPNGTLFMSQDLELYASLLHNFFLFFFFLTQYLVGWLIILIGLLRIW